MSLKIITGASGSGKSTKVNAWLIDEAINRPKDRFFLVVPDQFTMQTQLDLVKLSPKGGILNIEVLSFSRLAHRVFEETGILRKPVLDDTGKNLVLRKCANDVENRIPYLSGKLNKPGFIHEVKSAISEFMQYGVGDSELEELIRYAADSNRKTLCNKLNDLSTIYKYFKEYIRDNYITTEESMDVLYNEIFKSKILSDSTVIFDGFTGFTPIQNRVVGALMEVCKRVIITLSLDTDKPTNIVNEHDLFAFTAKTYESLIKVAKDHNCELENTDVLAPGGRYAESEELLWLERKLFRYPVIPYANKNATRSIFLDSCIDIREEVTLLMHNIRRLIREKNAYYRDIAIITGNLGAYSSEILEKSIEFEVPVYIDETKGINLNPFIEYIKSTILMYIHDFSYEYVFQYLRTGFTAISVEEIDLLEKYVLEAGIRGKKAYFSLFTRKTSAMKRIEQTPDRAEESYAKLKELNDIRMKMIKELEYLEEDDFSWTQKRKTSVFIKSTYNFISNNGSFDKLCAYSEKFRSESNFSKEKEYSQIYMKTCELLEQVNSLIGEETMDLNEFYGILNAGFDEIEVGMIPQSLDRVIVGDMERTRLKSVKYLFFLGLNDGWVPKSGGNGGIISDSDREFLAESDTELAPSPRMQQYINRFYLYSNLTKPSMGLFLSYIAMDATGSSIRPSYMVETVKKLFPYVSSSVQTDKMLWEVETIEEMHEKIAVLMRKYADKSISDDEYNILLKYLSVLEDDRLFIDQMIKNAFISYNGESLNEKIAGILYGTKLYASISKIETYAKCAYSYFLKYGLGLNANEEYGVNSADIGNIYHGVLETFASLLRDRGLDWTDFNYDTARVLVNEAVDREAYRFTDAIMLENARNKYILERIKSVMLRTVTTLAYQLKKSDFRPAHFEYAFSREQSLGAFNLGLNEEEKLHISGKIDRIDTNEKDGRIFVKIVDYKSGNKDFSLMSFYHGVQLQMVVYLNEVMKNMATENTGKEIVPAALLYYHIDDPLIETDVTSDNEAVEKEVLKALRTKGLVNDSDDVISSLDNSFEVKSDVIPVERKKEQGYTKASAVISEENINLLTSYAEYKLLNISKSIIEGDISLNPIEIKSSPTKTEEDSCAYCEFKDVCGFDPNISGYKKTVYSKVEDGVIIEKIKNTINGEES